MAYDGASRAIWRGDPSGVKTTRIYDGLGRVDSQVAKHPVRTIVLSVDPGYDPAGNVTSKTVDFDGAARPVERDDKGIRNA